MVQNKKNNNVEPTAEVTEKSYIWNTKEIPTGTRNIKVDLRTWNALKNRKRTNETFNDVILSLLQERTVSRNGENFQAIKYARKTRFLQTEFNLDSIGVEFEYNDVKSEQANFTLDLKIKKVFYGKRIMNPSEFFGVDNSRKHFNPVYLNIYLQCVALALGREFRATRRMYTESEFEDIALWRKIYYDFALSEESFNNDIEEPLRLSEQKPPTKIKKKIDESPSKNLISVI